MSQNAGDLVRRHGICGDDRSLLLSETVSLNGFLPTGCAIVAGANAAGIAGL